MSICYLEGFSKKKNGFGEIARFSSYAIHIVCEDSFSQLRLHFHLYTELKFQFWTKCYFLIIWNKHIGLSCRWGGGFLSNSQVLKTDVAVLTSGCDLRPWPLLDIINTKVLSFPQSSRVGVIYSCQWKKRYAESIEKLC